MPIICGEGKEYYSQLKDEYWEWGRDGIRVESKECLRVAVPARAN